MKKDCLDIGLIQAFLDGELAHTESTRVSSHIALCDGCANMLADADNESAMVFSALDREFDTLVPTQRLWNKINESIETDQASRPFWQRALAFVTVALANPSFAVAAGVIIVVGIGVIFFAGRAPVSSVISQPQIAKTSAPAITAVDTQPAADPKGGDQVFEPETVRPLRAERASYRPAAPRVQTAVIKTASSTAPATVNGYMPGEESYVNSIASLSKTVENSKDGVMRPSQRVAYERDLAVVNDAIAKMRKEVSKNPQNESARQVLYSSYQNKIDLLNSVSQKEELMASINRLLA